MKLDKIKFAKVLVYIAGIVQRNNLDSTDINVLDDMIDVDAQVQVVHPSNDAIERLMALMVEGTRKIEAIKEYRLITGFGLKESKDAVERYWNVNRGYSKAQLLKKLDDTQMSAECRANIDDFLSNLS